MAQSKKISVATVYGKIKLSELMVKKTIPLMEVFGVAVKVVTGISNFGEWSALQGKFEARNMETGEIHQAPQVFLPNVALLPIQVALAQGSAVSFAIRLSAKYVAEDAGHKAGGAPYEYTFDSMVPPAADDPLEQMRTRLLALAAPKTEAPTGDGKPEVPAKKNK